MGMEEGWEVGFVGDLFCWQTGFCKCEGELVGVLAAGGQL